MAFARFTDIRRIALFKDISTVKVSEHVEDADANEAPLLTVEVSEQVGEAGAATEAPLHTVEASENVGDGGAVWQSMSSSTRQGRSTIPAILMRRRRFVGDSGDAGALDDLDDCTLGKTGTGGLGFKRSSCLSVKPFNSFNAERSKYRAI